jgi:GNAT superfamily N-acetyltransferase
MTRDIVEAATANYDAWGRPIATTTGVGAVFMIDDLPVVSSGIPDGPPNAAVVSHRLRDAPRVLRAALDYFDRGALPGAVRVREGVDESAVAFCTEAGLPPFARVPLFVLDRVGAPAESPRWLRIEEARNVEMHTEHVRTDAAGFGAPADVNERLFTSATLEHEGYRPFTGYVDGRPVATSALLITDGIAGIYGVATIPEFRRRGIAEAMTRHAIVRGAEAGCTIASLQPSPMGRALYERMGFREVAGFQLFGRKV